MKVLQGHGRRKKKIFSVFLYSGLLHGRPYANKQTIQRKKRKKIISNKKNIQITIQRNNDVKMLKGVAHSQTLDKITDQNKKKNIF